MPPINVRTKGQTGERQVADALNFIVFSCMKEMGDPKPIINSIQRNQQQSAVGGADLTNTFELAIEIKRQEALSINTWWAQTVKSAERNNQEPVLIYRQNHKSWRVVMNVNIPIWHYEIKTNHNTNYRAEISWEDFLVWFKARVKLMLDQGHKVVI